MVREWRKAMLKGYIKVRGEGVEIISVNSSLCFSNLVDLFSYFIFCIQFPFLSNLQGPKYIIHIII